MNWGFVFLWWLIVQLLGLAALPLAFRAFRWLPDRGYAFTKALGLLLVSYLLWLGASTRLLPNDFGGILAALLLVAGLSAWLLWRGKERDGTPTLKALPAFFKERRGLVLTVEILFLALFVFWVLLRAYAPFKIATAGGEKYMETAFLNAILNSPQFPPLDPWLAGFSISYYYFGYVMMALMVRLSGVPATVGFDLYDALLFSLTAVGAFGVVYNLIPHQRKPATGEETPGSTQALRYGLLGAVFVALLGNLEGFLESLYARGIFPEAAWKWIGIQGLVNEGVVNGTLVPASRSWVWWWHASRVIWDQDLAGRSFVNENITEFPFFSFLLGDNHPHVLNLPFVLLAVGLALNLLRRVLESRTQENTPLAPSPFALRLPETWGNPLAAFGGNWPEFALYAFCLGALGFLNTWDFPIYLGLTVLAYGVGRYVVERRLGWKLVGEVAVLAVALAVAGVAFFVLFYVGFRSQAAGLLPYVLPPTPIFNYFVMFGPFLVVGLFFLLAALVHLSRRGVAGIGLRLVLTWAGLAVGLLASFFLLLASIGWIGALRQMAQQAMQNPAVLDALGGLSLTDAISMSLLNRLQSPWTFLLATLLVALAISVVWGHARLVEKDPSAGQPELPSSSGTLFAALMFFIGICLTLVVEFIFLRDGFLARMNTVFKFYYQAWIMLACASAYGFWWVMNRGPQAVGNVVRYVFLVLAVLLIVGGLFYPVLAIWDRADGFAGQPDMDAASEIAAANPDDWAAIQWLRTNAFDTPGGPETYGVPVILEAPGVRTWAAYTYEGRISTFTGLPTLLGWGGHESQWRGNYDEPGLREPDIAKIYTTYDAFEMLDLLHRWNVRYLVLGNTELAYIQRMCEAEYSCSPSSALRKFPQALTPVFTQGKTTIYQVP